MFKRELMKLSFQGASGRIQFNEQQEKPSFVNIFQVLNGMPELIGIYDPFAQNVTFTDHKPRYIPGDTFETRYELPPSTTKRYTGMYFLWKKRKVGF